MKSLATGFTLSLLLLLLGQLGGGAKISGSASYSRGIPTGAFASPSGTSGGNGSMASPWDLKTALANAATASNIENATGNTSHSRILYLRGGAYTGKFVSPSTGSSGNPIIIQSYPGEWAKIDGYWTTTLTSSIAASPHDGVTFTVTSVGSPGTELEFAL